MLFCSVSVWMMSICCAQSGCCSSVWAIFSGCSILCGCCLVFPLLQFFIGSFLRHFAELCSALESAFLFVACTASNLPRCGVYRLRSLLYSVTVLWSHTILVLSKSMRWSPSNFVTLDNATNYHSTAETCRASIINSIGET